MSVLYKYNDGTIQVLEEVQQSIWVVGNKDKIYLQGLYKRIAS